MTKSITLCGLVSLFVLFASVGKADAGQAVSPDAATMAKVQKGELTEAKASSWGFDPADSTEFLQKALDSGVKRLVIDAGNGPWIVRPLVIRSNQEIILEEGAEILAKRGEYKGLRDSLITLPNSENIVIRGLGKGATLRMWKVDYQTDAYQKAEWRNCVAVRGAKNVVIENLVLADSGGDGVCVGSVTGRDFIGQDYQRGTPAANITLRKLICDGNHRQGMSICSVEGILIEDCVLKNTSGTAPQAGIDFEPDQPKDRLTNCIMRNCRSENNAGCGYTVYLPSHAGCPVPFGLLFENCVSVGNRQQGMCLIFSAAKDRVLKGSTVVRNCSFENDRGGGISVGEKIMGGPSLKFENTTVKCWLDAEQEASQTAKIFSPVRVESRSCDELPSGEIDFGKINLTYKGEKPFFSYSDNTINGFALSSVTGDFTVDHNGKKFHTVIDEEWCRKNYPGENNYNLTAVEVSDFDFAPLATTPMPQGKLASPIRIASPGVWLVYAKKGEQVKLTFSQYRFGRQVTADVPIFLTPPAGKRQRFIVKGSLTESTDIVWKANTTGIYKLETRRGNNILAITQSNVPFGTSPWPSHKLVRTPGRYYFYVPQDNTQFGFKVIGSDYSPVKIELFDPQGNQVWGDDYISKPQGWFTSQGKTSASGIWSFTLARTKQRPHVECAVALFGVPTVLYSTPEAVLVPTPKKK